jgi:TolB-like protein
VVALLAWWWRSHHSSPVSERSIAVLPFANLSSDPDNAYFAVGIQDELLTHLAKLGALKVISRTSTQQYSARPGNLREIAQQLGVAHILEGSVQRIADRLHINVQLIRAATDEHIWAETFDRKADNILDVEAEVARAVAIALKTTLTSTEQQSLAERPTSNPAAYDAYLRGLSYSVHDDLPGNALAAINAYEEAVRLDPSFALAWARLARATAFAFFAQNGENFAGFRTHAKEAVDQARKLQPALAETVLAEGYVHYYCELNYDAAIQSFEKAGQLSPNNAQVLRALALCHRRKLQWERSLEYFARAVQLDPRDVELLGDQEDTLQLMHRLPAALAVVDKILEIVPEDVQMLATKAEVLHQMGDLARARALLEPLHPDTSTYLFYKQAEQLAFERKYADAIRTFSQHISTDISGAPAHYHAQIQSRIAQLTDWNGDHAAARKLWEQIRAELEPDYFPDTDDAVLVEGLSIALIGLGEKAKAIELERQLIQTLIAKNPIDAMPPQMNLARLYSQSGEHASAIRELTTLLHSPSLQNAGELRINPVWDPLRKDPEFQKLSNAVPAK